MSAEAPKGAGKDSEPSPISDFKTRLRIEVQEVTTNLTTQRIRAEHDRVEQERESARREGRQKEAKRKQEDHDRERRQNAFEEMKQLAEKLRIRDRLKYIKDTVWEGKGRVIDVSANGGHGHYDDPRVGWELVYSYKTLGEKNKTHHSGNNPKNFVLGYSWKFAEATQSISLKILISSSLRTEGGNNIIEDHPFVGRGGKYLAVTSSQGEYGSTAYVGLNPPGRDGVNREIDQRLIDDSTRRIKEGLIPSKLSSAGEKEIWNSRLGPDWYKWFRWQYVHTHVMESD